MSDYKSDDFLSDGEDGNTFEKMLQYISNEETTSKQTLDFDDEELIDEELTYESNNQENVGNSYNNHDNSKEKENRDEEESEEEESGDEDENEESSDEEEESSEEEGESDEEEGESSEEESSDSDEDEEEEESEEEESSEDDEEKEEESSNVVKSTNNSKKVSTPKIKNKIKSGKNTIIRKRKINHGGTGNNKRKKEVQSEEMFVTNIQTCFRFKIVKQKGSKFTLEQWRPPSRYGTITVVEQEDLERLYTVEI